MWRRLCRVEVEAGPDARFAAWELQKDSAPTPAPHHTRTRAHSHAYEHAHVSRLSRRPLRGASVELVEEVRLVALGAAVGSPRHRQPREEGLAHARRHVLAVEARAIEGVQRLPLCARCLENGGLEVVELLVHHSVAAEHLGHLGQVDVLGGHELVLGGHVDAVHVREAHRRRRGRHVHPLGASLARHLHDLPRRRAADDRVVDEEYVPLGKLRGDGRELAPHRLRAHALRRHDESAPDVAVLHKAFAVRDLERARTLEGRRACGVGHGYDDVDLVVLPSFHDLLGELLAHLEPRAVHRDAVEHRVGTREVDELEDARTVDGPRDSGTHAVVQLRRRSRPEQQCVSWRDVADQVKAQSTERATLRTDHELVWLSRHVARAAPRRAGTVARESGLGGIALAEGERANAVRVAETEQAEARDHRNDCEASSAALDGRLHCRDQLLVRRTGGKDTVMDAAVVGNERAAARKLRVGDRGRWSALVRHPLEELGGEQVQEHL
mmetsp:Transcript_41093/g.95971  ORF Transcript_41093/g.95971 Transcript_41093/m.95971 type:complete len:497 (-) Transcript_41093:501-1991(-)